VDLPDAQVHEDLGANAVVPQIRAETEPLIGLDRIEVFLKISPRAETRKPGRYGSVRDMNSVCIL
jgi:hypothetical protein